jgi:DNA-binding SARP family transcriptional activator/tetratricopeptide (TPR) repeat protein
MGQLNLAFLGTPEVRHAGQVVTFRTRKALALLIYLVVQGGRHSREKLTGLFWPESEEEQSRATLRSTLVYVRKTLGEMSNPTMSHLLIEHDAIGFNFASDFDLDLNTLQAAWTLTRTSPGPPGGQGIQEEDGQDNVLIRLRQALNVYRGDFLEGFYLNDAPDFEAWIGNERAYWHRRMDAICNRLSQVQGERGEIGDAIETTTRWVSHDPFNELAYRRLMQAHIAAGDRTAALRTYDTCRAMLAKEFNTRPAPETEALAERIRVKDIPRRKLSPVSQEQSRATTKIAPTLAVESPLIGRENEHSTLVTLYHTVSRAGPQVVALLGEAGIGKTRLATAFLGWATAQGADVLQGRAFEAGGRLPYQPLVEALRGRLAREHTPGELLTAPWLAELSRLLPELRERSPNLPFPASDEATARTRLFESIVRLGQALAKRALLVVFIDDVQWADASSLDLLHYICRSFAESKIPILLIFSLRSEALAITPELAEWLSGLGRDVPVTRLELDPLTAEETVQLIRSLAPEEVTGQAERLDTERFGRWLYAETGGLPFFLLETLKTLVERGILAVQTTEDGAPAIDIAPAIRNEHLLRGILPPGVREVIRARLARLPSHALSLLTAGAVLGGPFPFERLCQVASITENEGLPGLEALLSSRLLSEVGIEGSLPGEERFLFAHDKIRDVVYTEAGSTRRRLFHRRALETLQAAPASPAELAYHALAAGLPEAALRWSIAAGDEAMRLFAVRDALAHYKQAQRLARQPAGDPLHVASASATLAPSDLSHLFLQLGWAYELRSEFAQAKSVYEEMLTLAREMQESAMECAALNRLATLVARTSLDVARAEELLQQALTVAESSGNTAGVAETAWNLAQTGFYAGKISAPLPHAERALVLARELHLQELIGRSLHTLATLESALGRWEESLSHAEEARTRYVALGNREMEVGCLCKLAEVRINDGQPQEGINAARAALAISVEIEDPWGQINAAVQMVPGLLDCGAYTEALSVIQQGVALARALEITPLLVITLNEWGRVSRAMLALEAAHAAHSEALARCESFMPQQAFVERMAGELCADCALAGQWQEAYTYALKALAAREYSIMYGGLTRWHETEALLRGGSIEQAREDVRRFGERAHDKRRYRIPYLRALAVLAQWENEIDQAITHLEAARVLAEQLGLPGELWQILAVLGELYQSCKNESQAQQACARAAQVVQSLADGMEGEQQRTTFLSAQRVRAVLEHDATKRQGNDV